MYEFLSGFFQLVIFIAVLAVLVRNYRKDHSDGRDVLGSWRGGSGSSTSEH